MSRMCKITGKKPLTGNNVSHANNRSKRKQNPNLQNKRIWIEDEKRWVRMRLSTKAIKIIDKKGLKSLA